MLDSGGWRPMRRTRASSSDENLDKLPESEVRKVEFSLKNAYSAGGVFGNVHNGTNRTLKRVVAEIVTKIDRQRMSDEDIIRADFEDTPLTPEQGDTARFSTVVSIQPKGSALVSFDTGPAHPSLFLGRSRELWTLLRIVEVWAEPKTE